MSEGSLFEDVSVELEENVLDTLTKLCQNYKTLEIEIEGIEKNLKEKKKKLEDISRDHIPSILNSTGLSEVRLSSGEKIIVEDKVKSSITNKNYMSTYRNMILAELESEEASEEEYKLAEEKIRSLFKNQILIEEESEEVLDILLENDILYDLKRSIHPQTLNKYCREKLEHGKTIPEGISVFQFQETKIK